jgi:hypothetical protein
VSLDVVSIEIIEILKEGIRHRYHKGLAADFFQERILKELKKTPFCSTAFPSVTLHAERALGH